MKARVLISFHHGKSIDLDRMIEQAEVPEPPDLWADSGAFSAMTVGATITCEAYADWLAQWKHRFSAACTLDVIGDADGTMRNLERLESLGAEVLPVYHMRSERWDIFDYICDNYGHACIGGMAGTGARYMHMVRFLVHALRRARDRGSDIVFHSLGMVSDRTLNNVHVYSADCSTWSSVRRWAYLSVFDPAVGRMRDMSIRDGMELGRAGPLLRDHGLLDPGRLLREKAPFAVTDALAAVAFVKREGWIRNRLGPVHRPDKPDAEPGLRLYMSATSTDQITNLMRGAALVDAWDRPARPIEWSTE